MDLFFERYISRRDFIKTCGLAALGTALLPNMLKLGNAQTLGYMVPCEARHYLKLPKKMVKCTLCPRQCVVSPGQRGFCKVRENNNGIYYTLVHSNPCALHIDPIEKKPLFHFLPGTTALSIATAGCNFTCKNCQNWDISQARPEDTFNYDASPEAIVSLAKKYNTPTIAYTYTEPTIFYEYMFDTAQCANEQGILNIYHSNGYINETALKELAPFLQGANVDLKGYSNDFYKDIASGTLDPVLDALRVLKSKDVWLEITNLVIPTKNDSTGMVKDLCEWVAGDLGKDTPVHFSRFVPHYKLQNIPPTPIDTLRKCADLARNAGLHYVYIGNVPGIDEENTYCPNCGKRVIGRIGYKITELNIKNGRCVNCNTTISGKWE
jgi:pyruvate formate lyase activating enzyme